ncbi:MAG: flagellar basal-body rod protein FlgF [Rhodospirillaceae bacterium]
MENAGYIALSRQTALWRQMDQIANNMANVNTAGFKGEQMLFTDYVAAVRTDRSLFRDKIAYTEDFGTVRDLSEGAMRSTGNPFDVAIKGDGYFTVEAENGDRFYTRNGHFKLNADGQLATSSGELLISDTDTPVVFAPNETEITIARDGTISTENGQIGRLRLVSFDNQRALNKAGDGLYAPREDQTPTPLAAPHLVQGMLEGSNVNPVVEITRMINVQRSYERTQKMIDTEHQRVSDAIEAYAKQF